MSFKDEDQLAISFLLSYLGQHHKLSDSLALEYRQHCFVSSIKKNKYILSPVDNNKFMYYIVNGTARGFVRDHGKDITTRFAFKHQIIGTIRQPNEDALYAQEYLQALEDCLLVCIPYSFIDRSYRQYSEANIIGRKLLALQYHEASQRSILARINKAADRYKQLLLDSQISLSQIPLRYVASYLSIRLETLSRIRNAAFHAPLKLITKVA